MIQHADLWIHIENIKRHMRRILTILGDSPFLTGDHVYYKDVPDRELVIINADDFGLSPGVNRGILHAFREGILTSTTLLANPGHFDDAVALARETPELPVGVHLSVLWGPPVTDPAQVPSLLERDGRFPRSLTELARRYFLGALSLEQVRIELRHQSTKVLDTGLVPTHLDTHKHVHCLPGILEAVITLESMNHGLLPGTLNCEVEDPGFKFPILMDNVRKPIQIAMTNSFGFGGNNASLIFGRTND